MEKSDIENLLSEVFDKRHISSVVKHYSEMVEKFQHGDWEPTIAKGGKFIEAVLKSLHLYTGGILPAARQFKADKIITALQQTPSGSIDDVIRITIPRASRFVYDLASN